MWVIKQVSLRFDITGHTCVWKDACNWKQRQGEYFLGWNTVIWQGLLIFVDEENKPLPVQDSGHVCNFKTEGYCRELCRVMNYWNITLSDPTWFLWNAFIGK